MIKIIELTRKIETLTIQIANAEGIIEKETLTAEHHITRRELTHEIRKSQRA